MLITTHVPARRHRLVCRIGLAALSLALSSAVQAQQASGPPPADAGQATDIVVVGKRLQNIRNLAGTVNILSAQQLVSTGAKDAEDIFKLTPGIQFNKGSADGSLLTIRGIGTNTSSDNTSVGQLPTGIYIEDVPFTDPFQYISTPDLSAFDLDSVKVMRGPQGALYGSGSLGGAVNYSFKKPDLAAIGGSFLTTLDSAQGGNTRPSVYGAFNLPLVRDVLAVRFVGQYQDDPAYQDNIGTGKTNVNGRTVKGGRALLLFKPIDDLTIDALYIYQQSHQGDTSASVGPDVRYYDSPHPSSYNSHFSMEKLEINYRLGPVKLTSLTAHQSKVRDFDGDLTRLLVPDATVGIDVPSEDVYGFGPFPNVKEARDVEQRSSNGVSQEFRIASADKSAFNWLIGAFGQNVNFHRTQDVSLVGADDPTYGDAFFNVHRDGQAKERAVFGEANLDLGSFEIGAGGRYFDTSVRFHQTRIATLEASAQDVSYSHSENGFTPKFQARYRFDSHVLVYADAAKGYRFGGVNTAPGSKTYKSDNLWNYEAGIRLQPARCLSFDLAGFYIDWKRPQITSADQNGFLIVSNVAKATSKGIELSTVWHPAQSFTVSAGATYTDAKTKAPFESTRNFGTDVAGGFSGNFTVPSGTRLPGTPKFQASLQPEFKTPGPFDTVLTLSGTLSYTGDRRAQIDSDLKLPSFTTVDLRAKLSRDGWEGGIGVENLFGSKGISSAAYSYFSTGTGTDGYADYYLIRPRIISVSLRKDF
jgi:outer membrane receptor protein involved in Fe transport